MTGRHNKRKETEMYYNDWYKPNRRKIANVVRKLTKAGKIPKIYRNYPDGFVAKSYRYYKETRRCDYPIENGRVQWNRLKVEFVDARRPHGNGPSELVLSENNGRIWSR